MESPSQQSVVAPLAPTGPTTTPTETEEAMLHPRPTEASSATQSSASEHYPTTASKIYLQFRHRGDEDDSNKSSEDGTSGSNNRMYREAYLYKENTLAQLKMAVRSAFSLPPQQALLLYCGRNNTALHTRARNQDTLLGHWVQPGDVIRVALSDRPTSPRKKSPRLVQLTKKVLLGAGRRVRKSPDGRERDLAAIDGDSSLASTPPSVLAPSPLLTSHHHDARYLQEQQHHRSISEHSLPSFRTVTFQQANRSSSLPSPSSLSHILRQQSSSGSGGNNNSSNNPMRTEELSRAFYCPILLHLMADPVTAEDGVTYDRPAIQGHFARLHQEAAAEAHEQELLSSSGDTANAASTAFGHLQRLNRDNHGDDGQISDDEVSIPATPAAKILTVLWSPMTREVISDALVPNRALEEMIADAVDAGYAAQVLSEAEVQDWYSRRRQKLEDDRIRASARQLLRSSTASAAAMSGEAADAEEEDINALKYPTDTLSRLVRVDRPELDDRMGPQDSGLAVVAVGDVETRITLRLHHVTYCAVGCCTAVLETPVETWCTRCQRAVCRDCRVTQVTDIRSGSSFKPYEVCVECVLQLADVLAQVDTVGDSSRSRYHRELLEEHVRPRVEACWNIINTVVRYEGSGDDASDDASGRLKIYDDQGCKMEPGPPTLHKQSREQVVTVNNSLRALGTYPQQENMSLNLSFPTPSMRRLLVLFDRSHQRITADINSATMEVGNRHGMLEVTKEALWSEFCEFDPPQSTVAGSYTFLRMCPFCRTGPFAFAAANGCSNCGGGRPDEFDQWPLWDEIAGPH